jgi:hypothetical protein
LAFLWNYLIVKLRRIRRRRKVLVNDIIGSRAMPAREEIDHSFDRYFAAQRQMEKAILPDFTLNGLADPYWASAQQQNLPLQQAYLNSQALQNCVYDAAWLAYNARAAQQYPGPNPFPGLGLGMLNTLGGLGSFWP